MNSFKNKYGAFSPDGKEYIITTPATPRPWINVISNGDYGFVFSQTGSGYSWRTHAQLNRITRWEQDLIKDEWGKYLYVRDATANKIWSVGWKPVCARPEQYRCRHGVGYSVIESQNEGIASSLLVFVPNNEPLEIWRLSLHNRSRKRRSLDLFTYLEWGLGAAPDWHREFHKCFIETEVDKRLGAIFATKRLWEIPTENGHWNADWAYVAFHSVSEKPTAFDCDKETFLGMYGNQRFPNAVERGRLARRSGQWLDPIASLHVRITLGPDEEKTIFFTLGAADSRKEANEFILKYKSTERVNEAFQGVRKRWEDLLGSVEVKTPERSLDLILNTWLKYQAISGRIWGRTAYYQTGGAYGFRDQLQDSQIFLPIEPDRTKQQILLHARHQFKDGSVYHWWHPITEIGHVTTISDNLLWLPFVVQSYLLETDDPFILDEQVPFIDDPTMMTLYDHCCRSIEKALGRFSQRGLPLIGAGDWNDGLSAVGLKDKGESVWLGHFLYMILNDFSGIAAARNDEQRAGMYKQRALQLKDALNKHAWDGEWYFRATKDSGEKIGSKENTEGQIYLNAQTWSVIAGVADEERAQQVMDKVEERLEFKAGPILLHPAYKTPDDKIGYLTRYAAGMRENGGVYTHAATWAVIAEAMLGRSESAFRIFSKLNPINRGKKPNEYCAEPYVTSGNIDGPESAFYGRGGWTWYTGSAAWLFKVGLEWILGVRASPDGLLVKPCIPSKWKGYKVRRLFRGTTYEIEVRNPKNVSEGITRVLVDGAELATFKPSRQVILPLFDHEGSHNIVVELGNIDAVAP